MSPIALQLIWVVGFIIISILIFGANITIAIMLFVYEIFDKNREVAIQIWGGLNIATGILLKAWIDNPFDNAEDHTNGSDTRN